jgi:archaeal type IV pilus assembly protein PilA
MNVFGKRERSWRKAKRGVSPIIATILLVAITVVLAAVLYVLISGLTKGPGNTPIGTAFSVGNPTSSICATGNTYGTNGCKAADYIYTLTVETATASFASVQFEVKTSAGAILTAASAGGFTVENVAGAIAAQSTASTTMAMSSTFTTYGASPICNGVACSTSTTFSSIYTIVIDMGTGNPTGQGYTFVAIGTGSYSGTTSPVALP